MNLKLKAAERKILGRQVKALRRQGFIPGHIFGHNLKTIHVQVKDSDFAKIWQQVGETSVVDLTVDSTKHPVLIRGVQTHPLTEKFLHIDFYQVSLKEKVKVSVPIEVIGESPAVEKKVGLLLTPLTEVEIEALPGDIPEKIQADVSRLENIGDSLSVKDLKVDKSKVEVLADPELVVANIGELVTKEAEEVLAEEAAEREVAAAAEAGAVPTEEALPTEAAPAEEVKEETAEKPRESPEQKPEEKTE